MHNDPQFRRDHLSVTPVPPNYERLHSINVIRLHGHVDSQNRNNKNPNAATSKNATLEFRMRTFNALCLRHQFHLYIGNDALDPVDKLRDLPILQILISVYEQSFIRPRRIQFLYRRRQRI